MASLWRHEYFIPPRESLVQISTTYYWWKVVIFTWWKLCHESENGIENGIAAAGQWSLTVVAAFVAAERFLHGQHDRQYLDVTTTS